MTLLYLESFDHHGSTATNMNNTITRKADAFTGSYEVITGRGGSGTTGAGTNTTVDDFNIDVSTETEIIIGIAIKFRELNATNSDRFIEIRNPISQAICSFFRSIDGRPAVFVNTENQNFLASSGANLWSPFVWNYFELRLLSDATNGELELRMNGQVIINETGLDTDQQASPGIGIINFSGSDHFDQIYDDLYILSTEGTTNNDFLGDIQIEAVFPNAVGTTTDWAPTGAGTNHEAVDDNPFDDDTSYVSTAVFGDKDTYNFTDLSSITQGIVGVQMLPNVKKANATGTRGMSPVVRSGSTDYDQTEFELTTSYDYYSTIVAQDPDTGSAWTASGVNSAEFGHRIST